MTRIVVFGSLNADLVLAVPRLPVPGETVLGGELRRFGGGKGANQAVAAARLAAAATGVAVRVRMVGRVGADADGGFLRADLAAAGVDVSGVVDDPAAPSGAALIMVDPAGENSIAVAPGANGRVDATDADRAVTGLGVGDVLVCQLEVPATAVAAAAAGARARGARVVCNAAPARSLPPDLLRDVSVLVVNEAEARDLFGVAAPVTDPAGLGSVATAAGCAIVVTRGAAGAVFAAPDAEPGSVPAVAVTVVDTVGAGDAFVGGLAVALAGGDDLPEAVRVAVAAGALAVTTPGARSGPMPPDRLRSLLHPPPGS